MLLDQHQRPLRTLRISVTDRCNLRCRYCMPEKEYRWLERSHLLSFEELFAVAQITKELGVSKIRLTGGEPLLRQNLDVLVNLLSGLHFNELALTTNGILLAEHAESLKAAGLGQLTVSLDSICPETFLMMSNRDQLDKVLEGLQIAKTVGFEGIKLDCVVIGGQNDTQMVDMLEYAGANGFELRFIEYMDVGGATHWSPEQVVTEQRMLGLCTDQYGAVEILPNRGSAPAKRFRLPNGQVFGIISSTSQPFCQDCDRARLTADGQWLTCLYATQGLELRELLRDQGPEAVRQQLMLNWSERTNQGAVDRLHQPDRTSYLPIEVLRQEPRLEMHTRGG
jgi:GTP 3',8-cyclase